MLTVVDVGGEGGGRVTTGLCVDVICEWSLRARTLSKRFVHLFNFLWFPAILVIF